MSKRSAPRGADGISLLMVETADLAGFRRGAPLPKIGQQFGGRDHTTVMHADKKIRQLLAERRSVYNQVTELTNRIKQQARQS